MFALLASLVAIYSRLGGGKSDASLMEKVAVQLPFSVYFGWITVAAAANAAAALSFVGWISWTVDDAVLGVAATTVVLVAALTVIAAHKRRRLRSSHHMGSCGHSLESEFSTYIVYETKFGATVVAGVLVVVTLATKIRTTKSS